MTTIKDIAKRAEVSSTTVSRVLNDYTYVSDVTRKRVIEAINDLEYSPSNLARGMRIKKTYTIGLLIEDITNPFYAETAKTIISIAKEHGYSIILCTTNSNLSIQQEYISILRQHQIDGFLFGSVYLKDDTVMQVINSDLPYVLYNRCLLSRNNVNYVVLDNMLGSFLAVEHLVKLGHKRIGFIRGQSFFSTGRERLNGFISAIKHFNLDFEKTLIATGDYNEKKAFKAAHSLINQPNLPTAIIAANDLMAFSVMEALSLRGIRIPEDIALVGFDDVEMARHSSIQLTTVAQNKNEMAKIAIQSLIRMLEGKDIEMPVQIILKPKLIIRKTCGFK